MRAGATFFGWEGEEGGVGCMAICVLAGEGAGGGGGLV